MSRRLFVRRGHSYISFAIFLHHNNCSQSNMKFGHIQQLLIYKSYTNSFRRQHHHHLSHLLFASHQQNDMCQRHLIKHRDCGHLFEPEPDRWINCKLRVIPNTSGPNCSDKSAGVDLFVSPQNWYLRCFRGGLRCLSNEIRESVSSRFFRSR
jgi:hypothetical protein